MNKRGMMAQVIGAFIIVIIGISLIPVISQQIKNAQANITTNEMNNNSTDVIANSIDSVNMTILKDLPYVFGGALIIFGVSAVIAALKEMFYSSDENDNDNEDDDKDDYIDDEGEYKRKKHSTIIVPQGQKHVQLGNNYSVDKYSGVDKYELEKPRDNKLSLKEADFKKSKYD